MKLTTYQKLFGLIAIVVFTAGLYALQSQMVLHQTGIGGPLYRTLERDANLTADILPPPLFLVEMVYQVHQFRDDKGSKESFERLQQLSKEFHERLAYWDTVGMDPAVKVAFDEGRRRGEEMISAVFEKFVPAVRRGDMEAANRILDEDVEGAYHRHREHIYKSAQILSELAAKNVLKAKSEQANGEYVALTMLVFFAIASGLALWLPRASLKRVATLQTIAESVPVNVIVADLDLKIRYINESSRTTLKKIESHLPVRIENILGQCIDIFHKMPEHARQILANPRNLPHKAVIEVAGEHMAQTITAIYDEAGKYRGPMLTWEFITDALERQKVDTAMADRIRNMSENVEHASQGVGTLSTQLTNGMQQSLRQMEEANHLSQQVRANLQSVAAGSEEMTASIREIARGAGDAASVARKAAATTEEVNQRIDRLGRSGHEIGKAVDVISGIAEQTKLLALNATIEAARAGEAGKGFAVVASEVKQLADQTHKATGEIARMVEAIQSDLGGSVEAVREVGQVIGKINDLQGQIASAVEEQSATTSEIAKSVGEAARDAAHMGDRLDQVAQVTRETALAAESASQAANDLAETATGLKALTAERQSELNKSMKQHGQGGSGHHHHHGHR